jgi:proline iminopeptidase
MTRHRFELISIALMIGLVSHARAQPAAPSAKPEPTFKRSEVTAIIRDARKIVTADGVEQLIEVPIGGTRQWISVRGKDRHNPILLMIHGGPASPELPTSWWFQSGWEDYFTVVQWDQRGSGKSYEANDPGVVGPTLSLDRITEDAAEVVQYLRSHYAKPKIFVLGHSWGSVVGLSLAARHPEWLYAYIGMGQIISGQDNERVGYQRTLQEARARGNAQAVAELTALAPYPEADGSLPRAKLDAERKWSIAFGGLSHGHADLDYYFQLAELSPDYTASNIDAVDRGSQLSLKPLFADLMKFDERDHLDWRCPILLFEGKHDTTTPSEIAASWIKRVRAPRKQLIWFEHSAHMIMVEEPGRVLVHLVEDVLPLAR